MLNSKEMVSFLHTNCPDLAVIDFYPARAHEHYELRCHKLGDFLRQVNIHRDETVWANNYFVTLNWEPAMLEPWEQKKVYFDNETALLKSLVQFLYGETEIEVITPATIEEEREERYEQMRLDL